MFCGMAVAAAWLVSSEEVRFAWAAGPNQLYSAAGQISTAQTNTDSILKLGCRYDTTPVAVGDGESNAVRCQQTGEFLTVLNAALPAGDNDIGNVDLEFNGAAADTDVGAVSAATLRVVEASPSGQTFTAVDPDQVEAAADIAANASRYRLTCQNVGTSAARIRVGAATGGTIGFVLGGGASSNDGTGGSWTTGLQGSVFIYDLAGAGNADTMCIEETT